MKQLVLAAFICGVATLASRAQTPPSPFLGGITVDRGPALAANGSGYDLLTGQLHRTIIDMQVPGGLGKYGLTVSRSMIGTSTINNYKYVINGTFSNCFFVGSVPLENQCYVRYPDGNYALFVRMLQSSLPSNVYVAVGSEDVLFVTNDQYKAPQRLILTDGTVVVFQTPLPSDPGAAPHASAGGNWVSYYGSTSITDPDGITTVMDIQPRSTYVYNGMDDSGLPRLLKVTDPSGRYISYNWDSDGFLASAVGSNGDIVNYVWNKQWVGPEPGRNGRLMQVNYCDGTSAAYSYTPIDGSGVFLQTLSDVRSTARMQNVRINLASEPAHTGLPTGDFKMVVASERTFDGAVAVSSRSVADAPPSYFPKRIETRGDGPSRTVDYGESQYPYYDSLNSQNPYYLKASRIQSETDYSGNLWVYGYDAGNGYASTYNRSYIQDPLGRITTYARNNPYRKITQITRPDGSTAAWSYTLLHDAYYVASFTDERGNVTTYDRFPSGVIGQINYPDGSTEGWNGLNQYAQPGIHRFRNGSHEVMNYDSMGRLMSRAIPYFGISPVAWTTYTYYASGHVWHDRVQTITDPRGNATTYEYDMLFVNGQQTTTPCRGRGLVTKIINSDATYRNFKYDVYGNKVWERNELNQVTTYSYDAYQRVRYVTDPLGRTTETCYGDTETEAMAHTYSRPQRIFAPSGKLTTYLYDANKRPWLKAMGDWSSEVKYWRYEYDTVGHLTREREQVGGSWGSEVWRDTSFSYNSRDQKRFEYAPLSRTTEWQYDAVGNVTKVINPDGTFTRREYDAMNRVIHNYDELNQHTGYTYHVSGKVNVITDQRGYSYTHGYDASDRLTVRSYPAGGTEQWAYDATGNVSSHTNRSGSILRHYYDCRNRETERHWDGGAASSVWTYYDDANRVTQKSNWHGMLNYTYDAAGQMLIETQKLYGPTSTEDGRTETMSYAYDVDGNRTSFSSSPTGYALSYTYNARQQLSAIPNWASFSYSGAGERRFRHSANGTTSDYNFDGAGRLNYLHTYRTGDGSWILMQQFGHDLRDRRTWQVRDQGWGDTFEYQNDSQLYRHRLNVWRPDQNFWNGASFTDTFAYDAAGNRTSWNQNGAVTSYGTDSTNQYTSVSGLNIQHADGRGNITALGSWTFTYDAENRPAHIVGPGHDMWLCYDAHGRLAKIFHAGWTEYRFFEGTQNFRRARQDGSWIDGTIWGPAPDEVIARYTPATDWQFFHQDPLNSTVAITDWSRNVVERYRYDAFGAADIFDGAWNPRSTSAVGNRWQFTGQEWWPEMGLHNYKGRFYSSELGRFLQHDPIRFDAGDLNLYRYVLNNPAFATDPLGLLLYILYIRSPGGDGPGGVNNKTFSAVTSVLYKLQSTNYTISRDDTRRQSFDSVGETAKFIRNNTTAADDVHVIVHGVYTTDHNTGQQTYTGNVQTANGEVSARSARRTLEKAGADDVHHCGEVDGQVIEVEPTVNDIIAPYRKSDEQIRKDEEARREARRRELEQERKRREEATRLTPPGSSLP